MAGTMVANHAVGSASGDDEETLDVETLDGVANVEKTETLDAMSAPPRDLGAAREDEELQEALQRSMNDTSMTVVAAEAAMMKEALERSTHDQGLTIGPEHPVRLMKGGELKRLKRKRTPDGGII